MWVTAILLAFAAADAAPRFEPIETIAEGFRVAEGPVWREGVGLLYSDVLDNTIYRAPREVYRQPSQETNGLAFDREGRLVACEHAARRVTRTENNGAQTVIAEQYQGKRFNSPNDVAIRSDGLIYFTDPPYGVAPADRELSFSGVYAVRPGEPARLVARRGFTHPNGVTLSPDERYAYVSDSEQGFVRRYRVKADGALTRGRTFCRVPTPDGMKTDPAGRLWIAARDGVRVYSPGGALLTTLRVPGQPTNCVLGGANGRTLYVTTFTAVYRVEWTD